MCQVFKVQHQTKNCDTTAYQRYRKMTLSIREKLEQAGLKPRDLLDVHDFVFLTLKPSVRKLLAKEGDLAEAA